MKVLVEGENYSIEQLSQIFDDPKFYIQNGNQCKITSVGYYHSYEKKELVYMIPKVFMFNHEITVFDISKDELLDLNSSETFKHKEKYNWIRQLLVYFYFSLKEYKRRIKDTSIIDSSLIYELNSNLGNLEYSYLDLLLSFVNFYKKNKNTILYRYIDFKSNQVKKPKWEKTIQKHLPFIDSKNKPIYIEIRNKKKVVNSEEELLIYFFSILNRFNEDHNLHLKIDKSYTLIKGKKFDLLQESGLSKLRKIKHRYFSDTLKKMYSLCELYFSKTDTSSFKKINEEFISVRNYNIVFEDMIDKLFSDKLDETKEVDSISLDELKYNDDGKIIDHIYDYQSLIDTSNIFYIGDSKYYKSGNEANKLSKYKQFTYAKNVIQFNIDLLNDNQYYKENIRYRDEITEGYNITPNFFIYGKIENYLDFENDHLEYKNETPVKSFHFENRLFDRDTLFVHQYEINFLYVLKSYSTFNQLKINDFRTETKLKFRNKFVEFFNTPELSYFELFYKNSKPHEAETIVNKNFKTLNGKCYYANNEKLILAKHINDKSLENLIQEEKFSKYFLENSKPE
ncbi:LlaJI family restriction endonuclease [Flavobacterium covae]|uniref:LlaJI family restriction endonuclease n=1 Tax=Flavobacterium covae TaxID=2906076 RepID=UPI001FB83B3F|nr:LlaJI family restriction endonuclease [Flavobacterium covae]MCJ1806905.1 LlaJI family restriction endonuclease [Flavobacterium covae]